MACHCYHDCFGSTSYFYRYGKNECFLQNHCIPVIGINFAYSINCLYKTLYKTKRGIVQSFLHNYCSKTKLLPLSYINVKFSDTG